MQPLNRRAVRSIWLHSQPRLELASRRSFTPVRPEAAARRPSICLRCRAQFSASLTKRLYSDVPPKTSADTTKPSVSQTQSASIHELPSTTESRRSPLNQKFTHLMDTLQTRALAAGQTLNDITGYSSIDTIKADNERLETALAAAQTRVHTARQLYKSSNHRRASTQREVTTLLARKDTWSPSDLERFTELYRADHGLEGEVSQAQSELAEAEADEQRLNQRLNAGILKRYHEEQIWSDRIRRASTWGTWGLMGMNFLLFLVLQFVAEPWRRARLVRGVVAEEKAVLEEVREELAAMKAAFGAREVVRDSGSDGDAVLEVVPAVPKPDQEVAVSGEPWTDVLLNPERWGPAVADLYSERTMQVRMRDASLLAVEAAVTGALVTGSIAMLLLRRT